MNLILDLFFHLDTTLLHWVEVLGPWTYALAFLIIFCETGLIVMPFLPGDSFLFALGALSAAQPSALSFGVLFVLLVVAGILGDFVNFICGRYFGEWILRKNQNGRYFKPEHITRAHNFFGKHGGKAIVLARFLPILRTFAPFTAGLGQMRPRPFVAYNIFGSFLWVGSLLTLGYVFGDLPIIKTRFHLVIVGVIVVSFLPLIFSFLAERSMRGGVNSES